MRLQIYTTDDVVKEIDRRAAQIGISRNAMCAVLLHNAVLGPTVSGPVSIEPVSEPGTSVSKEEL